MRHKYEIHESLYTEILQSPTVHSRCRYIKVCRLLKIIYLINFNFLQTIKCIAPD